MTRLRALIVDDEPPAREAVATLLQEDPEVEVVGAAGDGHAALEAIRQLRPDLVFLDIQMPGIDGFEVAKAVAGETPPAIVFVTAYDQHALRAFELSAVDYLLKPFSDERFRLAVGRAKTRLRQETLETQQARLKRLLEEALARPQRLTFKVGGDYHLIDPTEILWVEAQGDMVKVAVGSQVHRVRGTLQEIAARLDAAHFLRVHRSFIVNRDAIRQVSTAFSGDLHLLMKDGTKIPVSRTGRAQIAALLG